MLQLHITIFIQYNTITHHDLLQHYYTVEFDSTSQYSLVSVFFIFLCMCSYAFIRMIRRLVSSRFARCGIFSSHLYNNPFLLYVIRCISFYLLICFHFLIAAASQPNFPLLLLTLSFSLSLLPSRCLQILISLMSTTSRHHLKS